ncbi:MAG TPA: hypothetical protein VL463_10435 [Kofleriaceae bacterium]|nr:hypothetical protein [Kofleriaceae bacterium]
MRSVLILIVLARGALAIAEPCADDPRYDRPDKPHHGPRYAERKDFVGKTAAQLVATFGEPSCKSKAKWRYWRPDGCSYEKDVVTLWFRGGKVSRVNIVHVYTGEECMFMQ